MGRHITHENTMLFDMRSAWGRHGSAWGQHGFGMKTAWNRYGIGKSMEFHVSVHQSKQGVGWGVIHHHRAIHHHRVDWKKEKKNVCHVTPPDNGDLSGTGRSYM